MSYREDLDRAIRIAVVAHSRQKRRNGVPYILHPFRVMLKQADDVSMIVAILHDTIEDTDVSFNSLKERGFTDEALAALDLLTHREGVPYADYIEAIKGNIIARRVKIADLEDNLNLYELPDMTDKDMERMGRYQKALRSLKIANGDIRDGGSPK